MLLNLGVPYLVVSRPHGTKVLTLVPLIYNERLPQKASAYEAFQGR